MNTYFPEIKKNFGFGCMRLPMKGGKVDLEETTRMVDYFLENGFNYFDTAHGYISGKSEKALKACLTSRYSRDRYLLVNKLTNGMFTKSPEGIRKFFVSQLEACGVDYFDFYLMHAQNREYYEAFKSCRAYETAFELKAEGKVRHVGLSFHDKAEVLDQILTEYPDIEIVQRGRRARIVDVRRSCHTCILNDIRFSTYKATCISHFRSYRDCILCFRSHYPHYHKE